MSGPEPGPRLVSPSQILILGSGSPLIVSILGALSLILKAGAGAELALFLLLLRFRGVGGWDVSACAPIMVLIGGGMAFSGANPEDRFSSVII